MPLEPEVGPEPVPVLDSLPLEPVPVEGEPVPVLLVPTEPLVLVNTL